MSHLKPWISTDHVWVGEKRHYLTPIGALPGVTTILSSTKEDPGLQRWKEWVGDAEAERVCMTAAQRGTWVHSRIEEWFSWQEVKTDSDGSDIALPFWESIKKFLPSVEECLYMEATVWHPKGYAGSFDFLGKVDGLLTLCDWKTSNKKRTKGKLADYRLQIGAYIQAIEHLSSFRVEQGIIAIGVPGQDPQVVRMNRSEIEEAIAGFNSRLSTYQIATTGF